MMFAAAAVSVLLSMGLAIARAFLGPTVYDRILAVNTFGTLTVVLISVHGFLAGRPEFLDLALVYAIINFIGTIAAAKYVTLSHLGQPTGDDRRGDV
jgi:multicomponent Na+:H+ antiporter subunit F